MVISACFDQLLPCRMIIILCSLKVHQLQPGLINIIIFIYYYHHFVPLVINYDQLLPGFTVMIFFFVTSCS